VEDVPPDVVINACRRRISLRPRAEEQLIILSAGTAARRLTSGGQIDVLQAQVDWSLVAELLRRNRLLPRLGPRLVEIAEGCTDEFVAAVTQAIEAGRRHGVFLQLITARVTALLTDAGIRCSTLKGPELSEILYGDPGRRPSNDIDLLVATEQLRDAVEVVRTLDYDHPTDHIENNGLPLLHFALIHLRGALPMIELHWRIHWYEQSFARDRLLAPSDELSSTWRPAPIDELTALLLYYARDGFSGLALATDIGAWWDAFGATLQPGALDESIRAYPALDRVLSVAARVAEKIVGLPTDRIVKARPRLGVRGRVATQLTEPYSRSGSAQVYADRGLVDGLLAPSGSLRAFVRRQVIVPREILNQHALAAQQERANSTLGHGIRVVSRYGMAMARLLWRPGYRWSK
jgi:hypothetical protein